MAQMRNELKRIADPQAARKAYLIYMFFWLSGISVVPAITYYCSIKTQENLLARKSEMIFMARSNLELSSAHNEGDNDHWLEKSNGSGIDGLTIQTSKDGHVETEEDGVEQRLFSKTAYLNESNFDIIYSQLQSPLTKDDYLMTLLQKENRNADWKAADSLEYTQPGLMGKATVRVVNDKEEEVKIAFVLVALILIPAILLAIFIWQT